LAELDDAQLESVSKDYIWLSEVGPEISRFSEYAWKRDACWEECERRKKPQIYEHAGAEARA
jgi:hypothetical protein